MCNSKGDIVAFPLQGRTFVERLPGGVPVDQTDISGPAKMIMPGSQHFLLSVALWLGIAALVGLGLALLIRLRRRRKHLPSRPPLVAVCLALVVLGALTLGLVNKPSRFFVPEFPALPRLFPEDAFFYRPIGDVPVAPRSAETVRALGSTPIAAGVSGEVRNGIVWGVPFNFVDSSSPRYRFRMTYPAGSDDVLYPISDPAYIQSMPALGIDNHYVAIDLLEQRMWELWGIRNWFGVWSAGSGALWDLRSTEYAKGSTTAAGLPMFPLVYTYEEVESGSIDHALGAGSSIVAPEFVWPARHTDGRSSDPDAPPMGTWLRLKAGADLSALGPQARVIAQAMQRYGIVITDTTTGGLGLAGTPDGRWDNEDLSTLRSLDTGDLEVIDASSLMVREDSMSVDPTG